MLHHLFGLVYVAVSWGHYAASQVLPEETGRVVQENPDELGYHLGDPPHWWPKSQREKNAVLLEFMPEAEWLELEKNALDAEWWRA